MQEQRSVLGVAGRGLDTASHLPAVTLGQAAAAVLEGLYESLLTPLGVAFAISLDRLSKSSLVFTFPLLIVARPVHVSNDSRRIRTVKLTELVLLFKVHVDDSTRPDASHLLAVKSTDFGEETRARGVAAVLSEEDWHIVLLELLGADVKARLLERRLTAPGVDVVAPEVDRGFLVTAVEISGQVGTNVGVIVGSIADTNLAVVLALEVGLGVTDSRLDESASNGVVGLVGDLVTSEETEGVVVLHQLVHHICVALVDDRVPLGIVSDNRVLRLRQIRDHVDASIGERVHAGLVVLGRIDGVYTDSVGLNLLEVLDVALACCRVGKRIHDLECAFGGLCGVCVDSLLVSDTFHEAEV